MKRAVVFLVLAVFVLAGAFGQSDSRILVRSNGSIAADDSPYAGHSADWFPIQVPEDGRIQITAVSVDISPIILIQRGFGDVEEIDGRRESAGTTRSVEAGELINIGVTYEPGAEIAWNGDPEYTLQVVFIAGELSLSVGGYIEGELDRGDEEASGGQYIDWYPLPVQAGTRIRVDLTSYDFDTYLVVELPDGSRRENDDAMGTDSSVSFASPSSGTARVGVRSYGYGDTGRYEVAVSEQVVTPISVGDTRQAVLDGPAAVYEIRGFSGQAVEVTIASEEFDTTLEISDNDGAELFNDDYGMGTDSRLLYVFGDSGSAAISVGSYGGTGEYTIAIRETQVNLQTVSDGQRLEGGEVITGRITNLSPQLDGYYHQRFTFYADEGERIEITLESDSFDAYLRLIDPSGFETTDDDSAGNLNSRITYTANRTGIHEIYARPLGSGETGLYTISFRRLADARQVLSERGQLTPNDDVDESGTAVDVYRLQLEAGRSVVIDVMSVSFDTRARLRDPDGFIVAENDDGASGSDSRIQISPAQTGVYELEVTSFSAGSYGNYRVEVFE